MKLTKTLFIIGALCFTSNLIAADDGWVEHNTRKFLDTLATNKSKAIEELSPKDARAVLANAQKLVKTDTSKIDIQEKTITVDGQPIVLAIVRPKDNDKPLPVFMFFHGGGWVLGDFPTHERFVRDMVLNTGMAAVFVNYTPSPEAKFPVAIHQAYGATLWVAEHGHEINVDGKKLAVVGNSAGGNIANAVSLMAKEKGTPKIMAQLLFWPVTDANFDTESYNKFSNGYFLTKNMMKWFWDNYTTDEKERSNILASPLRATNAQLNGLPPTMIQTAENDPLRDEGEAYAQKLDAAGVDVIAIRYNGMIHDYGLLNALSEIPVVQASLEHGAGHLKKYVK